jgi:hypothetical protein
MTIYDFIFRRGAKQVPNDELNAAVKNDHYVNAGDLEVGHCQKHQQPATSRCNCCTSAFRRLCVQSPFGIFLNAALCFNAPAIILALTDMPFLGNGCHASIWLLINGVFAFIHIAVAVYIALVSSVAPPTPGSKDRLQKKQDYETESAKARSLFLTNPIVVSYMWFVLFYTVFSFMPLLVNFQGKAQDLAHKYSSNGDDNVDYYDGNGDGYNDDGNDDGNGNDNQYYGQDSNSYNYVQAMKCARFSHEKVVIAMGFAWAFLIMGFGALVISFCMVYNADILCNDEDENVTANDYYQPPLSSENADLIAEQQQCGTFDDASEAPANTQDHVLASRAPATPPRQNKNSATQTSVERKSHASPTGSPAGSPAGAAKSAKDTDNAVLYNPNHDEEANNEEKTKGNDEDSTAVECVRVEVKPSGNV